MKTQSERPPSNAKRIYRWADLPEAKHAASFLIENEGAESFEITPLPPIREAA